MTICVNDLIDVMKKELMRASRQGRNYAFTQRAERMLRKAAIVAIKGSLWDLLDAGVKHMEEEKEGKEVKVGLSSPELGSTWVIAGTSEQPTRSLFLVEAYAESPNDTNQPQLQQPPLITPPIDLIDNVEADKRDIDIVLSQLKEDTMLQNLLNKRLMQHHQRVLTLEHRNGRKHQVVLPQESTSVKAFTEEERKSWWTNDMLYSNVKKHGMLMHLTWTPPENFCRVANQKKLLLNEEALNTPQTLALGHFAGLNNTQISKLRSFLKNAGKVELKHSKKEITRIDASVGLHKSLPLPNFNTYMFKWSTTTGKGLEKKPSESCNY